MCDTAGDTEIRLAGKGISSSRRRQKNASTECSFLRQGKGRERDASDLRCAEVLGFLQEYALAVLASAWCTTVFAVLARLAELVDLLGGCGRLEDLEAQEAEPTVRI